MPQGTYNSSRRRRKYYRKRYRRGGGSKIWNTIKKVGGIASKAMSLLNVERKAVNGAFSSTVNSTGTVAILSGAAQGSGESQRNGNQIRGQYVFIRGNASKHASATNTVLRQILFKDCACQGAAAQVNEVLDTSVGLAINAPLNLDNSNRS